MALPGKGCLGELGNGNTFQMPGNGAIFLLKKKKKYQPGVLLRSYQGAGFPFFLPGRARCVATEAEIHREQKAPLFQLTPTSPSCDHCSSPASGGPGGCIWPGFGRLGSLESPPRRGMRAEAAESPRVAEEAD